MGSRVLLTRKLSKRDITLISFTELLARLRGKDGLVLKDKKQLFTTYNACFSGNHLVSWLVKHGECTTRDDAIQVCHSLIVRGIVYPVGPYFTLLDFRELSENEVNEIIKLMKNPSMGIPAKDRKQFLTVHRNAFIGSESIDWFMQKVSAYVSNRREGEALGQLLMNLGVVQSVSQRKNFIDGNHLYIIAKDTVTYAIHENKQKYDEFMEALKKSPRETLAPLPKGKWDHCFVFQNELKRKQKKIELEFQDLEFGVSPASMVEPSENANTCDFSWGGLHSSNPVLSGRVGTSYPMNPALGKRDGDPVCDVIGAVVLPQSVLFAIADGCSWGAGPRLAAHRAVEGFLTYIMNQNFSSKNQYSVEFMSNVILEAFLNAHNQITLDCTNDWWRAGTTTLLGGMIAKKKLKEKKKNSLVNAEKTFSVVLASVGDCKAYIYSKGKIEEINTGSRHFLTDPRDCGGRLGPQLEQGAPDLRNFSIFNADVSVGDILFFISDGIHDNLDPALLGVDPEDLAITGSTWDDAVEVDNRRVAFIKDTFTKQMMEKLLSYDSNGSEVTTELITNTLFEHSIQVTELTRQYMEGSETDGVAQPQPTNPKAYPGKLDHVSCLSILVKDSYVEELKALSRR